MTFGQQVIDYHSHLKADWSLPNGFKLIYPFDNIETNKVFKQFYDLYFSDGNERTFLFGINPGRFGAGITGIPFTDPIILENTCGIKNTFHKRNELSAIFIYDMIHEMGGPEKFYSKFYITSVCHLGFIKAGKNINYYDDKSLQKSVLPKIVQNIEAQINFGANTKIAYAIGQGKNYKFLHALNKKHHFFETIEPLPHPRWVMQYRLKSKTKYLKEYALTLNAG